MLTFLPLKRSNACTYWPSTNLAPLEVTGFANVPVKYQFQANVRSHAPISSIRVEVGAVDVGADEIGSVEIGTVEIVAVDGLLLSIWY